MCEEEIHTQTKSQGVVNKELILTNGEVRIDDFRGKQKKQTNKK